MRSRTVPGKYAVGSWKDIDAADAQNELERQVMATRHLQVVRCLYREGADFPAHVHPQEQITIVEDGTLEFELAGESLRVGPGQMISIFPGVPHSSRVIGGQVVHALNLFHAPDLEASREAS